MLVGNALAPHATLVPDVVVAFPGGQGTADAVRRARKAGIGVVIVEQGDG